MFFLGTPAHEFLPAPLWLLTGLHVLTLALHLLAMNFLVGGLIVALTARLGDRWQNPATRRLLKLFPTLMAATVSFGVAPLLFAQLVYGEQLYSASIVSGWFWFAVPFVLVAAYYLLYGGAFAGRGSPRIGVFAWTALIILLLVSVVYSGVFALAERPDLQVSLYAGNQSGLVFNPDLGGWLPRWLHMILGALTVGGFFFGLLGRDDERAWRAGQAVFSWGTAAAALTGVFYLMSIGDLMKPFMRSPGISLLTVGALAGIVSVFFYRRRRLVWSGALLLVGMLGMVGARHSLRLVALDGVFDPEALPVTPQWGPFAVFAICLLIAVAVMAWMLCIFFAAPAKGEPAN